MAKFTKAFMPDDVFERALKQVAALNEMIEPFFYNLTPEEKKGLRKMAEGREGTARLISKIALANPNELAKKDDPQELADLLAYDAKIEDVRQQVLKLSEMIGETQTGNAHDIMKLADSYATSLQNGRSGNSALDLAMKEIDEYNARFAPKGNGGSNDEPQTT